MRHRGQRNLPACPASAKSNPFSAHYFVAKKRRPHHGTRVPLRGTPLFASRTASENELDYLQLITILSRVTI